MNWADDAACAGKQTEWWFGPDRSGAWNSSEHAHERVARTICESCPVRATCLDHALRNHIDYGMWGGLDEHERRALRRQRAS